VGLKIRDLSIVLDEVPSTTAARLNGYLALSFEQRRKIDVLIESKRCALEEAGKSGK
jgi:hypothetical protein